VNNNARAKMLRIVAVAVVASVASAMVAPMQVVLPGAVVTDVEQLPLPARASSNGAGGWCPPCVSTSASRRC
jgi:hypothetical protein